MYNYANNIESMYRKKKKIAFPCYLITLKTFFGVILRYFCLLNLSMKQGLPLIA